MTIHNAYWDILKLYTRKWMCSSTTTIQKYTFKHSYLQLRIGFSFWEWFSMSYLNKISIFLFQVNVVFLNSAGWPIHSDYWSSDVKFKFGLRVLTQYNLPPFTINILHFKSSDVRTKLMSKNASLIRSFRNCMSRRHELHVQAVISRSYYLMLSLIAFYWKVVSIAKELAYWDNFWLELSGQHLNPISA